MDNATKNTDREIYREPDKGNGAFYSDSIHVTEGGGIGINCGGYVIVRPLREWFALAAPRALFVSEQTMEFKDYGDRADKIKSHPKT